MNLLSISNTQTIPDIIYIVELLPKNYIIKLSIESYQLKGYNLVTYNLSKRGLCIFVKPNLTLNDKKLLNMLEDIIGMNYTDNIIVGDFNYKSIDWSNTCS